MAAASACVPDAPTSLDLDGGQASPPAAPVNLTARPEAADRVDLSWDPPSSDSVPVASYRLYRDGEPVAEQEGTTYTDTGLEVFTMYRYRVSALNADGVEGEPSDSVTARTLDESPPGAPGNVSAAAVSSTQIDLTWSAASDPESGISSYRIYRGDTRVGESSGTSFSDTGLTPETAYEYEVAAVNGAGQVGDRSPAVSARTAAPADSTPPTAPSDLAATAVNPSQVDLSWSAASDPESGVSVYRIYRDGTRVGEASGTSFSDTNLDPETTYSYEVSAVNGEGVEGPRTESVSVQTPRREDDTPPSEPSDLAASATGPTTVEVTWSAASDPESGVSSYRVYRDGTRVGEVAGTSFEDAGLTSSTSYSYEVSAVNGDGLEGPRAGPVSAATEADTTPPTAPSGLAAEAAGPSAVDLTWQAASDPESGISSYRIYRDGTRVGSTAGTSFEDTGLSASTTYSYEVSAVNGEGLEGPRTGPVSATTGSDSTPPTEPSDLSASATGATTVALDWSASSDPESGIAGYRIYRGGTEVARVTGTSYDDSGLTASTTYSYEVSAVNGEGLEGPRAGPVSATTDEDTTGPTAPSDLSANATGSTTVGISWSAASDPESGISGYRVYRDGARVGQTSGTSFSDTGLSPSTTYSYEVTAVNGAGLEGPAAGPASATTEADDTPPTAPSDLSANATGSTTVGLDWTAASDPESGIAGYRIYRDGTRVAQVTGTSYDDTGLATSTTYSYEVSAVNGEGLEGSRAGPASATTDEDTTEPSAPSNLSANATGSTTVALSWTAASDPESGVAGYRIYRDGTFLEQVTGTSYDDSGLASSTTYAYEVSAVNGDGLEGSRAGPESATTEADDTPPTAPSNLSANANGATTVGLSWTAASDPESGISGYRIYRDGTFVEQVTGTSYDDAGLTSSTTYSYEVSAVNGDGLEGSRAGPTSATTEEDTTAPTKPSDLNADATGPTSIDLTWSAASDPESGVAFYRVYRDGTQVAEVSGTSYSDDGLTSSTEYEYRVSAVNGEGLEGDLSGAEKVKTLKDSTEPTAPTDLTANATSFSTVELDWTAASDPESGIAFYRVYRNGTVVGEPTTTSFTDDDLQAETSYSYEVTAVNGDDLEGPAAGPVSETTPPGDDTDAAVAGADTLTSTGGLRP